MNQDTSKYSKDYNPKTLVFDIKREKFPDPRNYKYTSKIVGVTELPSKVDLREDFPPVMHQLSLNSCFAFAVLSVVEYLWRLNKDKNANFSELYTSYMVRKGYGKEKFNVGAYIIDAVKSPIKDGYVREVSWPYNVSLFASEPSIYAYVESMFWKLYMPKSYYQISPSIDEIKHALSNGRPIIFGMMLKQSFLTVNSIKTNTGTNIGGHAMVMVGYDDKNEWFIVRNSWGEFWGDKGYCYIPYTLLKDCFDLYCYV